MENKHRQRQTDWPLLGHSIRLSWYASASSWSNLLAFSIFRSRSRICCILRTYTWLGVGVGVGRILLTLYTFKSKTRRDKISHVSNSNNNKTTTQQNTFGNRRWSLLSYTWSQITLCEEGTAYCSILLCPCGSWSLVSCRLLHCMTAREKSDRRSREMRLLGLVCIWWLGWSTMLFTEYEPELCTRWIGKHGQHTNVSTLNFHYTFIYRFKVLNCSIGMVNRLMTLLTRVHR